jgi:hypothetical protein
MHSERVQYLDNFDYLVFPPYLNLVNGNSVYEEFKNKNLGLLPPPEWEDKENQNIDWLKSDVWLLAICGLKRYFNVEDLDSVEKLQGYFNKLKQKDP